MIDQAKKDQILQLFQTKKMENKKGFDFVIDSLIKKWLNNLASLKSEGNFKTAYRISWVTPSLLKTLESHETTSKIWGEFKLQADDQRADIEPIFAMGMDKYAVSIIVDSLLGEKSLSVDDDKPYTEFEHTLIAKFFNTILDAFVDVWNTTAKMHGVKSLITYEVKKISDNLPNIDGVYEPMNLWQLEVIRGVEEQDGTLSLIIPDITIDPFIPLLKKCFDDDAISRNQAWRDHWNSLVYELMCTLEIRLPSFKCSLKDAMSWKVGSTIEMPPYDFVNAYCCGHKILDGAVGQRKGQLALQLNTFQLKKVKGEKYDNAYS